MLAPSQLLAEPGHLPVSLLKEQNIPGRSVHLIFALGLTIHVLQLHSVILVRDQLFL
jgi:hypothetical protein